MGSEMNVKKVFGKRISTLGIICIILAVGVTGVILARAVAGMITAHDNTSSDDPTNDPAYYGGPGFYNMPRYYDWDLHWLGGSNVVPLHHP
jgi:hypothetical protein